MQREAVVSALLVGEQWSAAVAAIKTMLNDEVYVDEVTARMAIKAYGKLGLADHWRDVSMAVYF